jgi:hypothetical protein
LADTSLAASFTTARAEPVVRPGAFGEFVLLGGATLFALPLSWFARRWFGLDAAELAVGFTAFYGAHLINDPHFAVTYLLFYRDVRRRAFGDAFAPAQRLRYVLAGFAAPLLLLAWSVLAIAAGSQHSMALVRDPFAPPILPRIARAPVGRALNVGDNVVFNALAVGGLPLRFQWLHNGVPLPDRTNQWLAMANVSPADAGNYQLVATNDFGAVTSAVAVVTIAALV